MKLTYTTPREGSYDNTLYPCYVSLSTLKKTEQSCGQEQPRTDDMLPPATTCLTLRMRNKSRQHQTSHTELKNF
jgi:hypothetical protein